MKITRRRAILAAAATPIAAAIPVPMPASTLIEFVPTLWKFTPLADGCHGLSLYGASLAHGYRGSPYWVLVREGPKSSPAVWAEYWERVERALSLPQEKADATTSAGLPPASG